MDAIRYLATPLVGAQIRELRKAYQECSKSRDPRELVDSVTDMMQRYGVRAESQDEDTRTVALTRDDLRLVCFDVLSS